MGRTARSSTSPGLGQDPKAGTEGGGQIDLRKRSTRSAVSTALSPAGPIPVPTEPIVALKSTSVIRRGSSSDAAARVSWPCGSVSRLTPAARSIETREGIETEELAIGKPPL